MNTEKELIVVEGKWDLPYRHTAGQFISNFLIALRNKEILGIKCPRCQRILVPPRRFCERCFVPLEEWVKVGDQGTVETFAIQYAKMIGLPKVPYCLAFIKLDGSDTALLHFIGGIDLSNIEKVKRDLKVGMRVQAKWKEQREARITDIQYFKPITMASKRR